MWFVLYDCHMIWKRVWMSDFCSFANGEIWNLIFLSMFIWLHMPGLEKYMTNHIAEIGLQKPGEKKYLWFRFPQHTDPNFFTIRNQNHSWEEPNSQLLKQSWEFTTGCLSLGEKSSRAWWCHHLSHCHKVWVK